MMYYCDPAEDITLEEAHAILRVEQHEFWRTEDIPVGCERHFTPIDEAEIAEILNRRADANRE